MPSTGVNKPSIGVNMVLTGVNMVSTSANMAFTSAKHGFYGRKGKSEVQVLISCTICGVTALFLCATFWKLQLMPDYARINA